MSINGNYLMPLLYSYFHANLKVIINETKTCIDVTHCFYCTNIDNIPNSQVTESQIPVKAE